MFPAPTVLLATVPLWLAPPTAAVQSEPPPRKIAPLASAVSMDWRWHSIEDSENAAPVRRIEEGTDGTLWVGSDEGLAYFDGVDLRWGATLPRVPIHSIARLSEGRIGVQLSGRIWVGDRRTFSPITPRVHGTRDLEWSGAKRLGNGRSGGLFALTTEGDVGTVVVESRSRPLEFESRGLGGRVASRPIVSLDPHRISTPVAVLEDAIVDVDGVLPRVPIPSDWVVSAAFPEPSLDAYLVSVLLPPSDTGIWIVSERDRTLVRQTEGYSVVAIDTNDRGEVFALLQGQRIVTRHSDGRWGGPFTTPPQLRGANTVRFLSTGDLAVGGRDGVNILLRGDTTWERLHIADNGRPWANVLSLLVASGGDVWVGTSGGLACYRPGTPPLMLHDLAGVELDAVTALAEDDRGRIYVGSGAGRLGGVVRFDPDDRQSATLIRGPDHPGTVHELKRDPEGRVWALTLPDATTTAGDDPGGGSIWIVDDVPVSMTPPALPGDLARYYDAEFGPDGEVYVASAWGLLVLEGDRWERVATVDTVRKTRIYTLAMAPDGALWFATGPTRRGLYRREPSGQTEEVRLASGAQTTPITDIVFDSAGRLWAAGEDELLVHHEGVLRRAAERKLPIYTLAADRNGVVVGTSGLGPHYFNALAASAEATLDLDVQVLGERAIQAEWRLRTRAPHALSPATLTRYRIGARSWSNWSAERSARIDPVEPGTYEVVVEALPGLLPGRRVAARQSITVDPPLFERPAIAIPLGLLLGGILVVVAWAMLRLRAANVEKRVLGERFRQFADNVRDAFWLLEWETGKSIYVNPPAAVLFDTPLETMIDDPRSWRARLHPEDRERIPAQYETAIEQSGRWDAEFRLVRDDGAVAWIAARAFAIHDDAGRILRVAGIAEEITDRRASEDLRRRLSLELDHRVKNALSQVVAIAEQTLQRTAGVDDFAPAFIGRVRAMARSHEALSRNRWIGVPIEGIVEASIGTLASPERFSAAGPVVTLTPRASSSLALVLHELATNAAKYGALSPTGGRVEVRWHVDDGSVVRIDWREFSERRTEVPRRQGLGLTLVRGLIEHELGGVVRVDFRASGVSCTLEMPGSLAHGASRDAASAEPVGAP